MNPTHEIRYKQTSTERRDREKNKGETERKQHLQQTAKEDWGTRKVLVIIFCIMCWSFMVIIQFLSFSLCHFQLACGLFFPSLLCVSCIQLLSLPWCRCSHVLLTSCFILSPVPPLVCFMFSFARFCPPVFYFPQLCPLSLISSCVYLSLQFSSGPLCFLSHGVCVFHLVSKFCTSGSSLALFVFCTLYRDSLLSITYSNTNVCVKETFVKLFLSDSCCTITKYV